MVDPIPELPRCPCDAEVKDQGHPGLRFCPGAFCPNYIGPCEHPYTVMAGHHLVCGKCGDPQ